MDSSTTTAAQPGACTRRYRRAEVIPIGTGRCPISIVAAMEYAGEPGFEDVDARWIVGGPDSGGVRFFVLWREHLFLVEQDFSSGSISAGIAAAEFAATYRGTSDPHYQQIVEDLDARGRSH
jgi:hypothetical protein